MLSLESPRWNELRHAYGSADDIPALLRELQSMPSSHGNREPWFTLWSALAHQGDIYSASFAAVPHVVAALATAPDTADDSFLQFPAWVEICRAKSGVLIPQDLQEPYFAALGKLPSLVASASKPNQDPGRLACCLAALAVANGQPSIAEAVLELTPTVAIEFLNWLEEQ